MEGESSKRRRFGDLLGDATDGYWIQNILIRLPVEDLLRCKDVSPTWRNLIESSSFIDLHTSVTTFESSSSRFGSFIVHAAVESERSRKNALLMLSSASESVSKSSRSWYSESFGLWNYSFNGYCGGCDIGGSGDGLRWSNGCCRCCCERNPSNRDNILGGGWSSNDDQQQRLVLKLDNLGFPSCYQSDKQIRRPIYVVGSCNGLICLYDEQPNEVSLWNPATRQFKILPKASSEPIGDGDGEIPPHRLVAFSFDAETKDYKVVLLSFFNRSRPYVMDDDDGPAVVAPMECICRVEVYSLSTGSWSLLEGIELLPGSPYPYPSDSSGLFYLNGTSCFFMAKLIYPERCCIPEYLDDRFIISLDLAKQIITPIKLPSHHQCQGLYLCYLGNKIALFTKIYVYGQVYDVNDPNCSWERFHIWVFNEHRISRVDDKPWRRLHTFHMKLGIRGEMHIPRGISNDGVFALLETDDVFGGLLGNNKKKMKLYNLVTDKLKKNFLCCDQVLSKVYAYKPSLVSIEAAKADRVLIGKTAAAAAAEMDWKC